MESSSSSNNSNVVMTNKREALQGIRIENPFSFKVFQVFTGFGVGCGLGIGIGRPINLGAVPMLNQVMSATRGATDAFYGVNRHVNNALRKLGANNIESGIGCGIGIGHGFGVGFAMKPGVVQKMQACLVEVMMKMMAKFGVAPDLSIGQGALPLLLQRGISMVNEPSIQNPLGNVTQLAKKLPQQTSQSMLECGNMGNFTSKSTLADASYGSRTEKVLSSFLQNPELKEVDSDLNEVAGRLQSENNMLQMVLKHQQVIEELIEENEKLRQILVEDLKISPSKLQASYSTRNKSPCTDCFECRRKQRKK